MLLNEAALAALSWTMHVGMVLNVCANVTVIVVDAVDPENNVNAESTPRVTAAPDPPPAVTDSVPGETKMCDDAPTIQSPTALDAPAERPGR